MTDRARIVACCERWNLRAGRAYRRGAVGYALRVTCADGTPAVLKLLAPDRESEYEPEALRLIAGDGAVRVLDHDRDLDALLLERCRPGTPLTREPIDRILDTAVELLPRLWVPNGAPFRPLAEEAGHWLEGLERDWVAAGRPFERVLLDAAVDALESLAPTQGEQVLVNQDLHPGNVLAAEREPWLMIDPKPLIGEREFAVAPIVRDLAVDRATTRRVLDRLCGDLDLDRDRARGWALGQTVAWSFDGGRAMADHVDVSAWLRDA